MKQTYIAIIDCRDPRGRIWLSGTTRKLTDEEAAPYLIWRPFANHGRARLQDEGDTKARLMVTYLRPDGTEERVSWSEHLKRKYKEKRGSND